MGNPTRAIKASIVVRVAVEGFHRWPNAPDKHDYLRERHRHLFVIEAVKPVTSLDREVEIIEFGREIRHFITRNSGAPAEFGPLSCEQIAAMLVHTFQLSRCSVMEDGENGAEVVVDETGLPTA